MKIIRDIVCQVYYDTKSSGKIFELLNFYLPKYKPLNLDYTFRIDSEEGFSSNQEMIDYFVNTSNIDQTFYWNQSTDNPDNIYFGVNITNDNKTVFSLTIDGTIEQAEVYLNDLKQKLDSDIGFISFVNPAEYYNGIDFKNKYSF
ncbi:hypothetical protein [Chryseobacterium polytrichastri]|uniref:Uncharacterized protein n=1 Tax=Chryseobacterium polytrichastri TaxID=1302687 RepID=A0A1M6UB57_9FLAO|nr:hypothetical protein [Chryseobacterium polytrichastri]SHK66495.1 hypothetical protein SAMN05444267_1006111 [Chryseobacterium polytrichastri]